jgi:hypothetical protein
MAFVDASEDINRSLRRCFSRWNFAAFSSTTFWLLSHVLYLQLTKCPFSIMMNAVQGLLTKCAAPVPNAKPPINFPSSIPLTTAPTSPTPFILSQRRLLLSRYGVSPKDVGRLEVGTETIIDKVRPPSSQITTAAAL